MKTYLFFFSIGPVQGFIAQARKTIDLFAGSKMLSILCKVAIETFGKENVIIPAYNVDSESIPNRFVGKITVNENEAAALGKKIESAVRKRFSAFLPDEIKHIPSAIDQTETHLEIYWVFKEWDGRPESYQSAYENGENQLGSIKNIRQFTQIKNMEGEIGRKCSVDGERNVVVYRKTVDETIKRAPVREIKLFIPKEDDVLIVDSNDEKTIKIWELAEGEGLSAISYLKRVFLKNQKDIRSLVATNEAMVEATLAHLFPSTARVALFQIFYIFKNKGYHELEDLVKIGKHSDDQLLYVENHSETILKKNGLLNKKSAIDDLYKKITDRIENGLDESEKLQASFLKYYAMISFDGDNMGQWFSGDNLKPGVALEDFHRNLSQRLSEFARIAGDFLIEPKGKIVYAGEDFLGFINIFHLFDVVLKLKVLWDEQVNAPLRDYFKDGPDSAITFSAGIVIAHYKEPLSWVLSRVRQASKHAKAYPGKNSFTLVAVKHSGSDLQCTYPFLLKGDRPAKLIRLVHDGLQNEFSSTFIGRFEKEILQLGEDLPERIVFTELERTVYRACTGRIKRTNTAGDEVSTLTDPVPEMLSTIKKLLAAEANNGKITKLDNFTQMLSICDFLNRKMN